MLCAACGLAQFIPPVSGARAEQAQVSLGLQLAQANIPTLAPGANGTPPRGNTPGNAIPPAASGGAPEQIVIRAQRRLQKEKNSPSAVTELGAKQIDQAGVAGSTATLLRQAPSVFVYQQGIGYNEPVLSIRGTRGLEVAATLDDVPMQDLLNGGTGSYLTGNVGSRFSLPEISGVSIYPGVAYPNKNTFGTIGGTIAYNTKRPEEDSYIDLSGTVGSFETVGYGVEINTGAVDSPLGTGDNAARLLVNYNYLNTAGFIDYTGAHYNNFEAAFDKPFDDGLSKFQATVLYNTGAGYLQSEPTPVPLLDQFGRYNNYKTSDVTQFQTNDYLTVILKGDKYVNDNISVGLTAFYLNSDTSFLSYQSPTIADQSAAQGLPTPFVQVPYNFYSASSFLPLGSPGNPVGMPGSASSFYLPGRFTYNPARFIGTPACPASVSDQTVCGLNANLTLQHNDSYGIQPRATFILPQIAGIDNTVQVGALIAKETQPTPQSYIWGTPNVPTTGGYNQFQPNGFDGGSQRTIYLAYAQDKIDLIGNSLHITPGATLEGTASSNKEYDAFVLNPNPTVANPSSEILDPSYKLKKWDRELLPFLNVSYDLDQLLPRAKGLTLYASTGESALFAPASDFIPNLAGGAPSASIVHMYEGGVKYSTSNLLLSADYFYQKVDRDFGFFEGQGAQTGFTVYSNQGEREFKGFEAAGTWQVTPHWQVFGNTSYLLAKYLQNALEFVTVFEDQYGAGVKGSPISGIPDWLANFGVEWDNKSNFVDGDALSVRFSGQYTGQQYDTCDIYALQDANGNSLPGDGKCSDDLKGPSISNGLKAQTGGGYGGLTITDLNHKIPEFAVFNLLLDYTLPTPQLPKIKQVKFDLNIENLFDQRYWQSYYSQITPVAGTYTGASFNDGLPGEPFAVTFTVTARF